MTSWTGLCLGGRCSAGDLGGGVWWPAQGLRTPLTLRVALHLAQDQVVFANVLHTPMLAPHVCAYTHPVECVASLDHGHPMLALLQPTHPHHLAQLKGFQGFLGSAQFRGQSLQAPGLLEQLFTPMRQHGLFFQQIPPSGGLEIPGAGALWG